MKLKFYFVLIKYPGGGGGGCCVVLYPIQSVNKLVNIYLS